MPTAGAGDAWAVAAGPRARLTVVTHTSPANAELHTTGGA